MSGRQRIHDERGGVLALVAISLPVLLVMAALVVDVGNWFTHKRQLQNRADAGALAAGLEYAARWPGCSGSDPTAKTNAANAIIATARRFAGDANAELGIYDPVTTPPVNTEVANQTKLDVIINSTSYDAGTSYSDGAGGETADPCYYHATGDDISAPGHWTDVKIKERDLGSLFGAFGLPLSRNIARARVDIRPAVTEAGFVPLGIPDEQIKKAQVRFYNECSGAQVGATTDLSPLSTGFQTMSGMVLWGPSVAGQQTVSPGQVAIPLPTGAPGASSCGSGFDHIPIGMELRVAGRNDIDLNQSCSTLQSTTSADCFREITRFRVWAGDGQPGAAVPGDRPRIENAVFSGPDCAPDPYYARLQPSQTTNCSFGANIFMDWSDRPGPASAFTANLQVGSSTVPMNPPGGAPPTGIWTAAGTLNGPPGAIDARVNWSWVYKGPGSFDGKNCNQGKGCNQSGSIYVHKLQLADDPSGDESSPTDVVLLAKTTGTANVNPGSGPVSQFDSIQGTGATVSPYVTVGLKSTFVADQFRVLRLRSGQKNFSLVCDPRFPTPSSQDSTSAFYYGCQPPYDENTFASGFWWNTATKQCPAKASWFSGPPYPQSPWRCVHLDTGGNGFAVTDGIALRTGNCQNPTFNGGHADCQAHNYVCNNPIKYPFAGGVVDLGDPRIIKIYILPFGAYKNVQPGNGTDVPVINFAAFYVTGWKFNNRVDPCPSPPGNGNNNDNAKLNGANQGEVAGYFITLVEPGGPVDPNATCVAGQIRPCRAVLVR